MVGPSNTYFDTSADHSKTFKRDLHLQWEIYNNAIDFTNVFCNAEIDIYTLFHVKTRPRATFQSCGGVKTTIALKCRQNATIAIAIHNEITKLVHYNWKA